MNRTKNILLVFFIEGWKDKTMKPKRKKMISLYTKMFTKSANSFNYNQGVEKPIRTLCNGS